MTTETSGDTIGLVLAGGGARGAYEIGVLSRLLPALGTDAHWVRILAGTSIGSVNAAYLCSRADEWMRPVASTGPGGDGKWPKALTTVLDDAEDLWTTLGFHEVTGGLPRSGVQTVTSFFGDLVNLSEFRSLIDSTRLEKTLAKRIDFPRLNAHVGGGSGYGVETLAIAATSTATSRTTIFHKGGRPSATHDDKRGIDYVSIGEVAPVHVSASSAIPLVFRPVQIPDPDGGWYVDGFTRLNTPLKPALWLGAKRLIVIGLNGTRAQPETRAPDAFAAAAQVLQGLLADPLAHDVRELATRNDLHPARRRSPTDGGTADEGPSSEIDGDSGNEPIPYIFIAPSYRETIGALARDLFQEHYSRLTRLGRGRDLRLLGHLLNAGDSALNAELFSYVFFAREFAQALMDLGRKHADRWIKEEHDQGLWRLGQPPQFDQD